MYKYIFKLGGGLYLGNTFQMKKERLIDYPHVFFAKGKGVKSGNWQACTAINTPNSIYKFYCDYVIKVNDIYEMPWAGLTRDEVFEIVGLFYAINKLDEAFSIAKYGNNGHSECFDIKNKELEEAIKIAIKPMVIRTNELLFKLPQLN